LASSESGPRPSCPLIGPRTRRGIEVAEPGILGRPCPPSDSTQGPYRSVVLALLLAALPGSVFAAVGGYTLMNSVLLDIAITLGLATGMLIGVAVAQTIRMRPPQRNEETFSGTELIAEQKAVEPPEPLPKWDASKLSPRLTTARAWISSRIRNLKPRIRCSRLFHTPAIHTPAILDPSQRVDYTLCFESEQLLRLRGEFFAETDVSTQGAPPPQNARLSFAHEDQRGPQSAGGPTQEGTPSPYARLEIRCRLASGSTCRIVRGAGCCKVSPAPCVC